MKPYINNSEVTTLLMSSSYVDNIFRCVKYTHLIYWTIYNIGLCTIKLFSTFLSSGSVTSVFHYSLCLASADIGQENKRQVPSVSANFRKGHNRLLFIQEYCGICHQHKNFLVTKHSKVIERVMVALFYDWISIRNK